MEEPPSSPRTPFKFLCNFGGRILPRPSDGVLRYVGGEIRLLSIPRSVSFADLKEKISGMFRDDLIVKYELITDDLDVLISVKNGEDFYHMINEYDRHEQRSRSTTAVSSPRFRLFLFPTPSMAEPTAPVKHKHPPAFFAVSSAETSPTSPMDSYPASPAGRRMHRVRSTPNLNGGSPRGYQIRSPTYCNGAVYRPELCYGCLSGCGCLTSPPYFIGKYVYSPRAAGRSPPCLGNQRFHFAPPTRRVFWE